MKIHTELNPSAWNNKNKLFSADELAKLFNIDILKYHVHNEWLKNKDSDALRICSYNVHFFRDRITNEDVTDDILYSIKMINPDLLCMQEFPKDKVLISKIKKEFNFNYHFYCIDSQQYIGNITFSKKKFIDKECVYLPKVNKLGDQRMINKTNGKWTKSSDLINLLNIHLEVKDPKNNVRVKQINKVDNLVKNEYNQDDKIIILGDFNALPDYYNKEINNWIERNTKYHNIEDFIDYNTSSVLKNSNFIDATPNIPFTVWSARRVDYIFVRGLKVIQSGPVYVYGSDHLPIVADVI